MSFYNKSLEFWNLFDSYYNSDVLEEPGHGLRRI